MHAKVQMQHVKIAILSSYVSCHGVGPSASFGLPEPRSLRGPYALIGGPLLRASAGDSLS
jgi:hypothetical protein